MPNDSVASFGFLVCQMGSVQRISSIRNVAFFVLGYWIQDRRD